MKRLLRFAGRAVLSAILINPLFAFDKQATVGSMYGDVKQHPVQITETIYELTDSNGKLVELPTLRKTLKWYDWQNNDFVLVQYNDLGNPYLYEETTFTPDGLVSEYTLKTKHSSLHKTYKYKEDYSGYEVYTTVADGTSRKTTTFELTDTDGTIEAFEYTYGTDEKVAKTKKTTGYPYDKDLRRNAKNADNPEGSVTYYFYEDGTLSSIITEKDTATSRKRTYFVNNKRHSVDTFELNEYGDCVKETTDSTVYLYKYFYDSNGNWLKKDSFYEDKNDDIKYSHPLLRTTREIQYNGTTAKPAIPAQFFSFDSDYDKKTQTAAKETQLPDDRDASKVPSRPLMRKPFASVKKDPLDDKDILYIVFNAAQRVNEHADTISLIIRKKRGVKPEIYVNWKEFLNNGKCFVTYRIDSDKARTEEWTLSTDEKASFYDGDVKALLDRLSNADTFIVRTTPFNEPPCTAIFDVSTLRNLDDSYSWLFEKDY